MEGKGPANVATGCPSTSPYALAKEDPSTRGDYTAGGLYKPGVKDSTPDHVPNVACIPEPLVTNEPRSAVGNRSPYEVLGKRYVVMDNPGDYVERGTASYYGNKFHGRLTSNKEVYDMYAFTAAHKTLPLPSFALVTNTDTGQSVVVRVNDRGPFHDGRVIDLSYAAAVKLGITDKGTGNVEVRGLTEADNGNLLAKRRRGQAPVSTAVATARPAASASQIDDLVQRLPTRTVPPRAVATGAGAAVATSAATSTAGAQVTAAGERWRYRVADSRQPGNADNFDAWMKAQGVRVATGRQPLRPRGRPRQRLRPYPPWRRQLRLRRSSRPKALSRAPQGRASARQGTQRGRSCARRHPAAGRQFRQPRKRQSRTVATGLGRDCRRQRQRHRQWRPHAVAATRECTRPCKCLGDCPAYRRSRFRSPADRGQLAAGESVTASAN